MGKNSLYEFFDWESLDFFGLWFHPTTREKKNHFDIAGFELRTSLTKSHSSIHYATASLVECCMLLHWPLWVLFFQVKDEMDKLDSEAKVFKLIGPALVRQDAAEAKQNVEKRIGYISGEIKRQEELVADMDKKQDEEREKLQTLQTQMQKLAQA